ncbi:hypothetical protein HK405_009140 [Cladochytrium tenue]|nr:hypothetical protein HK405_009140 [Cladochytrium tenue]
MPEGYGAASQSTVALEDADATDGNEDGSDNETDFYLICDHSYSILAPSYGNFFALEGPFRYFRAWKNGDKPGIRSQISDTPPESTGAHTVEPT